MDKQLKIGIIVITLLVLLSMSVSATSFDVDVDVIDNAVLPNETASFNVSIINSGDANLRLQIYTVDPQWSSKVTPQLLEIKPYSQSTALLTLRPHADIPFGTRGMQLFARELNSGVIIKQGITVRLSNPDLYEGEYVPSIQLDVNSPLEVDPREPFTIDVNLRNRNKLDMQDLKVVVTANGLSSDEELINLPPIGEVTQEFLFDLDPLTIAGKHNLIVELFFRNNSVNKVTRSLSISEIKEITQNIDFDSFMFKKVTTITLENIGNAVAEKEVSLDTNLFKRIFSSKSQDPEVVKTATGTKYSWTVELEPNSTKVIVRTENYRSIIIILLLAIIGAILYYVYRSPILSLKEIVALHSDAGTSELKVRVFVKNRSAKVLDGVTVIDTIPKIAEYEKKHYLGSLAPTKVVSSGNKTLLKWELDVLEPFEERILVYNVKSKLKIIGRISLPNAKIKYLTKSGREKTAFSKNTSVLEQ